MKKLLRVVALLINVVLINAQQNDQDIFMQANTLTREEKYEQALITYKNITHKWAAVWLNMGVCSHELGNDAQALAYWLKTKRFYDPEMYQKAQYYIKQIFPHAQKTPIADFVLRFPVLMWQLLFLIMLIVFLLAIIFVRNSTRKVILLLLSLLLLLSSLALRICYRHYNRDEAVVLQETPLYLTPQSNLTIGDTVIPQASIVKILESTDDWYKITVQGRQGWLAEKSLISIKELQ